MIRVDKKLGMIALMNCLNFMESKSGSKRDIRTQKLSLIFGIAAIIKPEKFRSTEASYKIPLQCCSFYNV